MEVDVQIVERATGNFSPGIIRPANHSDKVLWTHWHAHMPVDAEDGHWEWDELIDLAIALPERFAVYSLEAAGELQGIRMLEISENEVEEFGIHALRLSTAPWNRNPGLRYRGVGSLLVGVAILQSLEDGYGGRVHCESLPNAETFHEKNGMVRFDELSHEGLNRFRLTEDAAQDFLSKLQSDGLIQ